MSVEGTAFVLRRNWAPVIGALAMTALAVITARVSYDLAPFAYVAGTIAMVMAPLFWMRNAFPRATPVKVRATAAGLVVVRDGEETEVSSEEIVEAKLVPRRSLDAVVDLALRNGRGLSLQMRTLQAKALVEVIGARRTRFRLVTRFWSRFSLVALVMGSMAALLTRDLGELAMTVPSVVFWSGIFAWLVGRVRGRLVVGADGITTRWLLWQRFVPFKDVSKVEGRMRWTGGVVDTVVVLASGKKKRLRTVEAPNTEVERGAESHAMLAHVQEAFERSRRLADAAIDVPSLVGRGSRSAREWLSALDALVRGGGSRYRVAAVSPEMLADVAGDPGASVESRVGAAAALVRMGDESHRGRIRISAEACAEPNLRDVLLALSEARDDEATEAALASVRPGAVMGRERS